MLCGLSRNWWLELRIRIMLGRSEGENALRDAVLLTADGDDLGPAGAMLLAFQRLAANKRTIGSRILEELAELIGLRRDGLADRLLAEKLGWACGMPLMMGECYGAAFSRRSAAGDACGPVKLALPGQCA